MAKRERTGAHRALFIVAVVALTGCGCGADAAAPPSSSSSRAGPSAVFPPSATRASTSPVAPATTAPRWTPEQQEVVDAYFRALDAEHKASQVPDPDLAELLSTHEDPLLAKLRDLYRAWRLVGQRARPAEPSVYRVDVEEVRLAEGGVGVVVMCSTDDWVVFEQSTGRVINDDLTTARLKATLRNDGVEWRLAERTIVDKRDGGVGCVEFLPA